MNKPSKAIESLYALGPVNHGARWQDYLQYGFNEADIPALVDLIGNPSLLAADPDSREAWLPLHAWRALGQLGSPVAIAPLLGVLNRVVDDHWAQEELPQVLAMLGEQALAPLAHYLGEGHHEEPARIIAAEALKELAHQHPQWRAAVVKALCGYLHNADDNAPGLNAMTVGYLIDLKAVEAIATIRELYQNHSVDISRVGPLEAVEAALKSEANSPLISDAFSGEQTPGLYEEVDHYLTQYANPHSIQCISELDGFLTAVLCAPKAVVPAHWGPAIWGSDDHRPQWPDRSEEHKFVSAVMVIHNQIARALDDDTFTALFLEKEEEDEIVTMVDRWCQGFLRGATLWDIPNNETAARVDAALNYMQRFANDPHALAGLDDEEVLATQQKLEEHARDLYRHFRKMGIPRSEPFQAEPKVGRNDPCPCGSGKKFKKCCLH